MKSIICSVILFAFCNFAVAQGQNKVDGAPEQNFDNFFKQGVSFYQQKKYQEAQDVLSKALKIDSNNLNVIINLALTEFQLGNKNMAVALLRKASHRDPSNEVVRRAIKYVLPRAEIREIAHEIVFWESLRANLLNYFSLPLALLLGLFSMLGAGLGWIKYFSSKKLSNENQTSLPSFSIITILLSMCLIFFVGIGLLKAFDFIQPRGTIVADTVKVRSAPGEDQAELFELYGGLEVILESKNNGWVQITYPGALTGWVPFETILQTSGKSL